MTRRTKKERTALDRLAEKVGATVEHVSGPRMRLVYTTQLGNRVELEGTTQRCLAQLVFYVEADRGMELADVARVTGFVGPVTIHGLTGPDEHRLVSLARVGRELKGGR